MRIKKKIIVKCEWMGNNRKQAIIIHDDDTPVHYLIWLDSIGCDFQFGVLIHLQQNDRERKINDSGIPSMRWQTNKIELKTMAHSPNEHINLFMKERQKINNNKRQKWVREREREKNKTTFFDRLFYFSHEWLDSIGHYAHHSRIYTKMCEIKK